MGGLGIGRLFCMKASIVCMSTPAGHLTTYTSPFQNRMVGLCKLWSVIYFSRPALRL